MVTLLINNKIYQCNEKAITPIRFRSEFGFSFITEYIKDDSDSLSLLTDLFYISLDNKVERHIFVEDVKADNSFIFSAFKLKEYIFKLDKQEENIASNSDIEVEFDELNILAQMGICHLSERLLHELTLFQIVDVIRKYFEMKNPQSKAKILKPNEVKSFLGITPDVEEKIRLAMERGK